MIKMNKNEYIADNMTCKAIIYLNTFKVRIYAYYVNDIYSKYVYIL
jgi:hypothetical protein